MAIGSRGAVVVLTLVACLLVGGSGVVMAQAGQQGGTVVVEQGETVDGVDTTAGTVVIRGTVEGDVQAVAGSVVVENPGRVTGDVSATAGSVTVLGTVEGSVDAAAGSVYLGEAADVGGDLRVGAGSLLLAGSVDGAVEAGVDRLELTDTASIGGDPEYGTDTELVRADGATVGGSVREVDSVRVDTGFGGAVPFGTSDGGFGPVGLLFDVYGVVVTLLFGAVLLLAFPDFTTDVVREVREEPLRSGAVGLGGLVGIPLALLAIAITILGLPLSLLGLMVFGLLMFTSAVLGEYAVGRWTLSAVDIDSRWAGLVAGVVGVALLLRIPVVGWLVNLVVFLLGFGAVLVLLYEAYQQRPADESDESTAVPAAD